MRYMLSRAKELKRERIYRIYVTDSLKILCGTGERYIDLIYPDNASEDDADPDEIINDLKQRLAKMAEDNSDESI